MKGASMLCWLAASAFSQHEPTIGNYHADVSAMSGLFFSNQAVMTSVRVFHSWTRAWLGVAVGAAFGALTERLRV